MKLKMLIMFYLLLMLTVGRCSDVEISETKTVGVGDYVKLTCTCKSTEILFWIRLVSGDFPELLGGTLAFDYNVIKTPRITANQDPGTFLLHINKTELSDTGFYYCIKANQLKMMILKRTFLIIKGPESDNTAIIQVPPSDPVCPEDSVTLQCSVLSDPENKTCPREHSVYWFRAGSESHPSVIYPHGNSGDECEKSPEDRSPRKCVYNFSKNIRSSDAGTYYCAVATCGEILFGNATKLAIEELNMWDLQKAKTVIFLLCAALATSLIVIVFLIYIIKKTSCGCCKTASALRTNAATATGDQQRQQRDEESLVYSAPTFTKRRTGRAERRNANAEEGETIYTDVRPFVMD